VGTGEQVCVVSVTVGWPEGDGTSRRSEAARESFSIKLGTLLATKGSSVQGDFRILKKNWGTPLATKVSSVQACWEFFRIFL
jgi:hypothetical protein